MRSVKELQEQYDRIMATPLFEVFKFDRDRGQMAHRYAVYADGRIEGFPPDATTIMNSAKPMIDALFGEIHRLSCVLEQYHTAKERSEPPASDVRDLCSDGEEMTP